jgi:signal peptidase II
MNSPAEQKAVFQRATWPPYPWAWLFVTAVIVYFDWDIKHLASESLTLYRPVEVLSWLNLTLAHNYGAAFSFLSGAGGWQRWLFTILPAAVSLFLLVWLLRLPRAEWRTALALALVLGGAIGNLAGRIKYGYVVDFVDVHYAGWHFPAFNLADAAISCGIALLLIDGLLLPLLRRGKSTAES